MPVVASYVSLAGSQVLSFRKQPDRHGTRLVEISQANSSPVFIVRASSLAADLPVRLFAQAGILCKLLELSECVCVYFIAFTTSGQLCTIVDRTLGELCSTTCGLCNTCNPRWPSWSCDLLCRQAGIYFYNQCPIWGTTATINLSVCLTHLVRFTSF